MTKLSTKLWNCHRGPASTWCDHDGPGGFMGHTCGEVPVPMVLRCPVCNGQHIDEANRAIGWLNPPHRTHLCNFCGHLWCPFDYHTEGVA